MVWRVDVPTGPAQRRVSSTAAFTSDRSSRTRSSWRGSEPSAQTVRAIRSRGSCSPPDSINFVFAMISSRVMPSPPSSWRIIHESTDPSGSRSRRSITRSIASPSSALARSAGTCFSRSPSKFARPGIIPSFHRRMSSHGISSSPSMNCSERTDIGSQYSVNRSTSPRPANPSTSSCASLGIMPCVRSSTSRGRNGDSVMRRMRCWSGPSEPSMLRPIVRFRVDGSVWAVKISGVRSTYRTSS